MEILLEAQKELEIQQTEENQENEDERLLRFFTRSIARGAQNI